MTKKPLRKNFVNIMVGKFTGIKAKDPNLVGPVLGQAFSDEFKKHYKNLFDQAIKRGKKRRITYLSSMQSSLSNFKRLLLDENKKNTRIDFEEHQGFAEFLKNLRLSKEDMRTLQTAKRQNVHAKSIDLPEISGDAIIKDCRLLLKKENPYLRLIGVACLTGRRMAEIMHSMTFEQPTEPHFTNQKYWTRISGICKQRVNDPDPIRYREVPLLGKRQDILRCIQSIRAELPASSVRDVNKRYGKSIQRAMRKYCPEIGNLHQFRKFYVLACFHYFNERNCSLPRLAADYLGHKTLSDTVITYLNFRMKPMGALNFKL
jgi:hypothetical protein